jgi:hypothetical protein
MGIKDLFTFIKTTHTTISKLKDYKKVSNILQVPITPHLRYFTMWKYIPTNFAIGFQRELIDACVKRKSKKK